MSRYRSEESRQKARQSIMRTLSERSRKVREYDKLAQDRTVLLSLVREGIECGGSTRQFLRWVERAKFIIANEPASSQETVPAPEESIQKAFARSPRRVQEMPGPKQPPRLHGDGCRGGDYARPDCPALNRGVTP